MFGRAIGVGRSRRTSIELVGVLVLELLVVVAVLGIGGMIGP